MILQKANGCTPGILHVFFKPQNQLFVLSCLVLSCLVLFCLVLSCLVLSCLVLSCLVLSCLVLSCLVLSCSQAIFTHSYLFLTCGGLKLTITASVFTYTGEHVTFSGWSWFIWIWWAIVHLHWRILFYICTHSLPHLYLSTHAPLILIRLSSKTTTANHANPKPAKPNYGRFYSMPLSDCRTAVANELCVQTSIFVNCWSQIKQICVIFTHLRLWIAVAKHNLKWVIKYF